MGKEHSITIPGHPSVYSEASRELNIYFYEPEKGVNSETGILLIIPGFGGNSQSNVYKKMRKEISEKYNLVTVQCDYFGWQYMQQPSDVTLNIDKNKLRDILPDDDYSKLEQSNFNKNILLNIIKEYEITIEGNAILEEDLNDFNDMGIMQAIDNINAVLVVMAILKDNKLNFNKNKVLIYGHSQGAYLSYLCNAFAPNLFSLMIDNSAWMFPQYIDYNRLLIKSFDKCEFIFKFNYLAGKINLDKQILDLESLYSKFKNNCNIICFHGTTDNLISNIPKQKFCTSIENCIYNEIDSTKVDGNIFKSTNHGLDSDFLKLFELVMRKYHKLSINNNFGLNNVKYETDRFIYYTDYSYEVPRMSIYKK